MTDYQKYINALRKCAKEHENDTTYTGHIIVSDLCRDTANLLEALEQEPTTKNDLGVENDLVSSIVEKISEKVTETHEEFIFETIRPYCEDVVQMKISKRDLEQALLKYYGKNNLGVDCISSDEVEDLIYDALIKCHIEPNHAYYVAKKILKENKNK